MMATEPQRTPPAHLLSSPYAHASHGHYLAVSGPTTPQPQYVSPGAPMHAPLYAMQYPPQQHQMSAYDSQHQSPDHGHDQLQPPQPRFADSSTLYDAAIASSTAAANGDIAARAVTRLPPILQVEKQHVTTTATQAASASRRRNEAQFKCPVPNCGSTFTRRFNLRGHLRSHTEERPFVCEWPGCGKGFARQHDCKRHQALHGAKTGTHSCVGCGKTFSRMDALNRHLRSDGGKECRDTTGQPKSDSSATAAATSGSASGSEPNSNSATPLTETTTLEPMRMHLFSQPRGSPNSGHSSPHSVPSAVPSASPAPAYANLVHSGSSGMASPMPNNNLNVPMMNALLTVGQQHQQQMQPIPINGHSSHHASPLQLSVPLSRGGSQHNTPRMESIPMSQTHSRVSSLH